MKDRSSGLGLTSKAEDKSKCPVLITCNSVMLDLLEKIKIVAETDATVLITGENGTGKEILASLVHYHSGRRMRPMITVDCGSIPIDLVESELFGHEKGAFTGATEKRGGCFEWANKSTLFLDEIGEMPISSQVKLLRAVELGSFRRVGGREEIFVEVRLIFATNKILLDQVKSGRFREDLYYRINVIELYLPPLRHRREDIPLLASHFSEYFSRKAGTDPVTFSQECMDALMSYEWPGNVRELRNIVERSVVLKKNRMVTLDILPFALQRQSPKIWQGVSFPSVGITECSDILANTENSEIEDSDAGLIQFPVGTAFTDIERIVISETLTHVKNNKTQAAKILGLARKTLHNKLEKYRLEEEIHAS